MERDQNPDTPEVPYWHVWTDENGVSRQDRCRIANFKFASISSGAAPSWIGRPGDPAARVVVLVLPAGWVGEWREFPEPQWLVPLSGSWIVKTIHGTHVNIRQG